MSGNRMKDKLQAGKAVMGVSVMIPSPQLVEMIGRLGFDWVLLDGQHGTISLESLELMVMAAEASGITPIARPASNRPEAIMQVLDRGAQGVQVPHVNTGEVARNVVDAARHHPDGSRRLAVGTRAARYGFDVSLAACADQSNRDTLVCVQIEDAAAISNLDALLNVEGIDVFFVGPSDLSQSMGYPGQSNASPVREAVDDALSRIRTAGRIAGCAGDMAKLHRYRNLGTRYLYTHFSRMLASASREILVTLRFTDS